MGTATRGQQRGRVAAPMRAAAAGLRGGHERIGDISEDEWQRRYVQQLFKLVLALETNMGEKDYPIYSGVYRRQGILVFHMLPISSKAKK